MIENVVKECGVDMLARMQTQPISDGNTCQMITANIKGGILWQHSKDQKLQKI